MLPYQIVCGFLCFINNFFWSVETVIKTNTISSCFPESQSHLGDFLSAWGPAQAFFLGDIPKFWLCGQGPSREYSASHLRTMGFFLLLKESFRATDGGLVETAVKEVVSQRISVLLEMGKAPSKRGGPHLGPTGHENILTEVLMFPRCLTLPEVHCTKCLLLSVWFHLRQVRWKLTTDITDFPT